MIIVSSNIGTATESTSGIRSLSTFQVISGPWTVGGEAAEAEGLLDALEAVDDVQEVYTNAVIDESA